MIFLFEAGDHRRRLPFRQDFSFTAVPGLPPEPDDHDISVLGLMSYLLKAIAKLSIFAKIFFKKYADSWQSLKTVAFSLHKTYKKLEPPNSRF